MSIISKMITVILTTTIWINPNIVTLKVSICMICIMVSVIVVVGVSMMVVTELMKTEFVPKLLTAVGFNRLVNDWTARRKLVESCLLYRLALVDEFSREAIFVLTLSSIVFAYFSDVSVFASSFMLVLHL